MGAIQHGPDRLRRRAVGLTAAGKREMPVDRLFVKYHFFKVDPEWRRLKTELREQHKNEFCDLIESKSQTGSFGTYSTVGIRGDTDFLIRQLSEDIEAIHDFGISVRSTGLGDYLETPYSYLAVTRRSAYVADHSHSDQEGSVDPRSGGARKYFVVYPFVKRRDWYSLPFESRREMMQSHIETGHKYPDVRINTSYSFGIDDQEFVVAFDTDDLIQFVDLVMELRDSAASAYTERDVPAFTCISVSPRGMVDAVDGTPSAVIDSKREVAEVLR